MSFARVLRRIVEESGGGLAAILMGRDGIPIEQVEAPGLSPDEAERLGNAGVELGRILDELGKASDAFGGGSIRETVVGVDRYWLVLRPVDDETFLLVALGPDGNLGKARFLVRRHLAELRAEL